MLIGMNVLIIVLGAGLAVLAGNAAGEVVEQRLVRQVAENAGKFLVDRRLPLSDALMNDLRRLFGVDFVAVGAERSELLALSLVAQEAEPFMDRVRQGGSGGRIDLGGLRCRFDSHEIRLAPGPQDAAGRRVRVFVVAPDTLYQDARAKAVGGIVLLAVPAIAVASLLAVALSLTISRPLRRLAGEMDKAVTEEGQGQAEGEMQRREAGFVEGTDAKGTGAGDRRSRGSRRGPSEVVRLGESFDQLLKRLSQAQVELARSERLATLGRVAAGVAHELRNPLSGIKMNLRVLQDEMPRDAPGAATTELVLREVDRMDLFVRELMALAAGDGRGDPPAGGDLPGVDLAEAAESVVALLDGRLRHARVTVERSFPAELPAVRGDAPRVRQVLMNLIVNAMEAMPGGGTLHLSAAEGDDNGLVRFSVADSGDGVHVRDMDVFDAFTSTKAGGVGLGLYLCRKIIQAQGGRIGYENTGQGAVFWFELPAGSGK